MNLRITLPLACLLLCGCANNSTENLIEPAPFVEYVTYIQPIKPIIDSKCIQCHSNPTQFGAPMPLTTYELVKGAITQRPLLEKISKSQGDPGLMPQGGPRLPQATIDLFYRWYAQGMQQ